MSVYLSLYLFPSPVQLGPRSQVEPGKAQAEILATFSSSVLSQIIIIMTTMLVLKIKFMLITSLLSTVLCAFHGLSSQILNVCTSITTILQMRRLRHRVASGLHAGNGKWQSQDLNLGPQHQGLCSRTTLLHILPPLQTDRSA